MSARLTAGVPMTDLAIAILERQTGDQAAAVVASERGLRLIALAHDTAAFLDRIAEQPPDVALVDIGAVNPEDAIAAVATLASRGDCAVVALGGGAETPLLSRAVIAGARAFVLKPFEPEELLATIREVSARSREAGAPRSRREGGAVVAVYGPKGGSGRTTIATSLGVALAARKGSHVGIVDLDLQFGDVGIALDLKSPNSVVDLTAHAGAIDPSLIDDLFVTHRSGLRAILAPEQMSLADAVDATIVTGTLDDLRAHFDVLICDLPARLDDLVSGVLATADVVLLVTTPELASLKDLQRALLSSPRLQLDGRSHLIVNRWPSRAGVPVTEVERALRRKVAATVPSEGVAVTEALNSGVSLLDAGARTSKSIRDLADLVERQVAARR